MNCHAARNLLDLHAEGRLSPSRMNSMDAHLADCVACRSAATPRPKVAAVTAPTELKARLLAAASRPSVDARRGEVKASPAPAPRRIPRLDTHRAGELALLAGTFLLPVAFSQSTFNPFAPKTFVLQWTAVALIGTWLIQGVSRGRFQLSAASLPAFAPAAALALWTTGRFLASPFKLAAWPGFAIQACLIALYLGCLLAHAGARPAARLATAAVAAGWLVVAARILEAVGAASFGPFGLGGGASFLALIAPLALTLSLDPESPPLLKAAAAGLIASASALTAAEAPVGRLVVFSVSCVAYAVIVPAALRTRASVKSGLFALIAATASAGAWRMLGGHHAPPVAATFSSGAFLSDPHAGIFGALLWTAVFATALATALRGAVSLRRNGLLAESVFAAGFSAAAVGALAAAWIAPAGLSPIPEWIAWPLAGTAAGLAALAVRRSTITVFPLPVSEGVRRVLYAPSLIAVAGFLVPPALWLRSDAAFKDAVVAARVGDVAAAEAAFSRVLPGAPDYVESRLRRADVLLAARRYPAALVALDDVSRLIPDFGELHLARARAYAARGESSAEARERQHAADFFPGDLANLASWSAAARIAGDLAQARRAAAQAAAIAPTDPAVKAELAANDLLEQRQSAERGAALRRSRKGATAARPKKR